MTLQIILQALISGLLMGFIYALVAAGLSLIFGLMEIVNFAHGEFMMLSMYITFWCYALFAIDPILSIPICIVVMFLIGVATHYAIIRQILNAPMLVQITATFGLAIFLRSLAQFLWSADYRVINDPIVGGRIEVMGIYLEFHRLSRAQAACWPSVPFIYLSTEPKPGWRFKRPPRIGRQPV